MTGPAHGVIGADPEGIIKRAERGLPAKMVPHEGENDKGQFNGVIFEFDDLTNKVVKIQRIRKIF